jgi:hypothetical protein
MHQMLAHQASDVNVVRPELSTWRARASVRKYSIALPNPFVQRGRRRPFQDFPGQRDVRLPLRRIVARQGLN